MPEPTLGSIRADIDAIRAALTRLGALPPPPERKPRKGRVFVYLYADTNDIVRSHASAIVLAPESFQKLLACVEVFWREGEGLTGEERP